VAADHHFEAMGTRARLFVHGGPADLVARLEARVEELEDAWSRFRPDSDVSRMNADPGSATSVSPDTIDLVRHALLASWETGGWFDPTMGVEVAAAGYDRTFARLTRPTSGFVVSVDTTTDSVTGVRPWRGHSAHIDVDAGRQTVTVPAGIAFDPGGIGKGRAADLVAEMALAQGATGVMVDLGGDIRFAGTGPRGGWSVSIDDPFDRRAAIASFRIPAGGVATSSVGKRRWSHAGAVNHHLLDPSTGTSSTSDVVSATVLATEAWWAEAIATAAVVAGVDRGLELCAATGTTGLLIDAAGHAHRAELFEAFAC